MVRFSHPTYVELTYRDGKIVPAGAGDSSIIEVEVEAGICIPSDPSDWYVESCVIGGLAIGDPDMSLSGEMLAAFGGYIQANPDQTLSEILREEGCFRSDAEEHGTFGRAA